MVLSSHLSLSASTDRNGEYSPGACIPWGLDHTHARGMASDKVPSALSGDEG